VSDTRGEQRISRLQVIAKDFDGLRETLLKSNGLQSYHGTSKDFFDSDGLQTRSLNCFPLDPI